MMTTSENSEQGQALRAALIERLKTVNERDPLWNGLLWLIDENRKNDQAALCVPIIGDEAAHRARGRLSAWVDLYSQMEEALLAARVADKADKSDA